MKTTQQKRILLGFTIAEVLILLGVIIFSKTPLIVAIAGILLTLLIALIAIKYFLKKKKKPAPVLDLRINQTPELEKDQDREIMEERAKRIVRFMDHAENVNYKPMQTGRHGSKLHGSKPVKPLKDKYGNPRHKIYGKKPEDQVLSEAEELYKRLEQIQDYPVNPGRVSTLEANKVILREIIKIQKSLLNLNN